MGYTRLIFGRVSTEGRFIPDDPRSLSAALRRLAGKEVQLTVEKKKNERSLKQNAYYWGVIVKMIADWLGYEDKNEVHEILKAKFLRRIITDEKLGFISYARSTARLTTEEFEDYCENIRTFFAREYQFIIPLPGEVVIKDDEEEEMVENA